MNYEDLSLRKQNMFFVEMTSENTCPIYPLNSDWKDCSDWFSDIKLLTLRSSLSPTFRNRLLSRDCVKVQYRVKMPYFKHIMLHELKIRRARKHRRPY